MKILIVPNVLSDKSVTYDVRIGDEIIPAYSEDDAWEMANKIAIAIGAHSTEVAELTEG